MQQEGNQQQNPQIPYNRGNQERLQSEYDNPESQVITYTAPWNMFAMGFSNKPAYPFRLAVASFLPEAENQVNFLCQKG